LPEVDPLLIKGWDKRGRAGKGTDSGTGKKGRGRGNRRHGKEGLEIGKEDEVMEGRLVRKSFKRGNAVGGFKGTRWRHHHRGMDALLRAVTKILDLLLLKDCMLKR
jgi:hypothetical protein